MNGKINRSGNFSKESYKNNCLVVTLMFLWSAILCTKICLTILLHRKKKLFFNKFSASGFSDPSHQLWHSFRSHYVLNLLQWVFGPYGWFIFFENFELLTFDACYGNFCTRNGAIFSTNGKWWRGIFYIGNIWSNNIFFLLKIWVFNLGSLLWIYLN